MVVEADPVADFVAKWAQMRPEFALALRFLHGASAPGRIAFACLAFELEHAALSIADDNVAGAKLAWWAEEFMRLGQGSPQHPLTRELAGHGAADVPIETWQQAVVGAMAQRDPDVPSSCDALLTGFCDLYVPLAEAEARMLGGIDAGVAAQAAALSHAVHACAASSETGSSDRLAVPLDVLARHASSRHDFESCIDVRHAVLRDHLQDLTRRCHAALSQPGGGVIRRTALAADRMRAKRAAAHRDPIARLRQDMQRLPPAAAWTAWRSARTSTRA